MSALSGGAFGNHPQAAALDSEQPSSSYTGICWGHHTDCNTVVGFQYVDNVTDDQTKWEGTLLLESSQPSPCGLSHRG